MLYIYGASGHGCVVFETLLSNNKKVTAFIDDTTKGLIYELPIYLPSELRKIPCRIHFAIGDNEIRKELQEAWTKKGITPETIIHPYATCYQSAQVGGGSLLAAGSIVGPNARVGLGCIINHNAVVDHGCNIGDFCHISPAAIIRGDVTIGDGVFVGAGSVIINNITISDGVIIPAGSVITENV